MLLTSRGEQLVQLDIGGNPLQLGKRGWTELKFAVKAIANAGMDPAK